MDYPTQYKALSKSLKEIRKELTDLRNSLLSEDERLTVEAPPAEAVTDPGVEVVATQDEVEDLDEGEDFFAHLTKDDHHPREEELFESAIKVITELGYASTLVLQQRLGITYRRAMDLIDRLEHDGLIGPAHGFRPHKALSAAYTFPERTS